MQAAVLLSLSLPVVIVLTQIKKYTLKYGHILLPD